MFFLSPFPFFFVQFYAVCICIPPSLSLISTFFLGEENGFSLLFAFSLWVHFRPPLRQKEEKEEKDDDLNSDSQTEEEEKAILGKSISPDFLRRWWHQNQTRLRRLKIFSIRRLSFPPITTYTAFTPYNDNGRFFLLLRFFLWSQTERKKNPRFVFPWDMAVDEVLFQNIDLISFGETGNWFSSTPPFDTFRREKIGKWRNSPVVEILEWQQKSWLFWAGLSHLGQRKREHKLEFEMWLALFTNQRFFA